MAATIEIPTTRPGETLTLSAFPDGSDTAAFTGEALTEASNRDGVYSYSNATETGLHLLVLYAGATPRWQAWAVLATDGTVVASDSRLEALYLDASVASRAAPGAEMDLVDAPNADAVTAIQTGLSTFDAGADTVNLDAAYDAAKTAAQAGDAMTLSDGAITSAKIADGAITNAKIGGEIARQTKLDTVEVATAAIQAATDLLPDGGALTSLAQGDDLAGVGGNVSAILEDTGTTIPGLINGLNDLDATAVQTATEAALTAYDPPTRAEATSDKEAVIAAIPASSANATAVRAELTTELGRIDAAVSTRSSHSAADVWSVTTRTLSSFGTLVTDVVAAVWAYSGAATLLASVASIFGKLPSADYLTGSPNSDGSVEVAVGEVQVSSFSSSAKQQLAGTTIRMETPVWSVDGFDTPLISGDAYQGDRAWTLIIEGYTGPDLTEAESIQMDGTRDDESFSFPFTATKIDDTTYTLTAELDSEDTDISKGVWSTHLYAVFGDSPADRVTLIGPKAKLKVIGT